MCSSHKIVTAAAGEIVAQELMTKILEAAAGGTAWVVMRALASLVAGCPVRQQTAQVVLV
jgi:hypothetical protein